MTVYAISLLTVFIGIIAVVQKWGVPPDDDSSDDDSES
jgi:hypothetical protein